MTKRVVLWVLMLGLALGVSLPALAQGTGSGQISGLLVNGTEGGGGTGGLEVTLVYSVGGQAGGSMAAQTDQEGRFTFGDLSTDASYAYQVLATYQGVHYTSTELAFAQGETSKSVQVDVYETTDSDASVSVMLGHIVFDQAEDALQVRELYLVVNTPNRTYIGSQEVTVDGKRQTMSFSLPEGAANVQFANGLSSLNAVLQDKGIAATLPIKPGMNAIGYTYELRNKSNSLTFSKKIDQPIGQINVLGRGENISITGEGLTVEEPLNIDGVMYSHAAGQGLVAGDVLTVQLSGLTGSTGQSMVLWVVVALGVLAVGGAAAYVLSRRRAQPAPAGRSGPDERRLLLEELARLDDEFESGKLSEQDYHSARAATKAKLVGNVQHSEQEHDE